MGNSSRMALALVALALLVSISYAESLVAINSFDGRDVLSGIFYANAKGLPVRFMPVPGGSSEVFAAKVGSGNDVLLIQSSTNPVSGFVESDLAAKDNKIELFSTENGADTNLALASRSGAQSFIVVDSAFSDGAISVLPYAKATRSYVIFADNTNIEKVKPLLSGKKVTIYGYVDSKVLSELSPFSPQRIGRGEDKYADNVELVGKLMGEYGHERALVTDGSVIEDSIAEGSMPILLTGRLVPQVTYDFVKEEVGQGKLTGVLLVGSELVFPVYDMRERVKNELEAEGNNKAFGVLVKFAQAIPSAQAGVLTLDTFRVPAYKPKLDIAEIVYNSQTDKVMVGLENSGEGPLYFTLELKVLVDGSEFRTFGEPSPRLIERGESTGLEYPLDLAGVQEGAVTAQALIKYGGASRSLEEFATSDGKLASISYSDNSNVSARYASYDAQKQLLSVTLKNNNPDEKAYAFTKLTLTDEQGSPTRISGAAIREVEPATLFVEEFPLILTEKEVELNREVTVTVDYGGRRGFLSKNAVFKVPLERQGEPPQQLSSVVLGAAAAVVLLILLYGAYILFIRPKGKA